MRAPAAASHDFDVAVVGGGPAGAATAGRLAQRGRRVVVLEREPFPRFHIGESQLPWSDEVFRALGVDRAVAAAGFVEKWGASFTSADGAVEQYADFAEAAETPRPQTWQVTRSELDRILLEHARGAGAHVIEGAEARDASFTRDHAELRFGIGPTSEVARVAAIVDASGRTGFLARRLVERRYDQHLRNVAVHAWYEGVPRRAGRRAGDIRMVTRPDRGWFWFIPVSETVTSVGLVVPKDVHAGRRSAPLADALDRYVAETPAAAALLSAARRVSEVRFDADYSYESSRYAGDRWLVVGDAGAFLDPIFSTGVLLALQAGIDAADALDAAIAAGDLSRARFRAYEQAVAARYRWFRRFATGFYDPAFREVFFRKDASPAIRAAVVSVLAGNWRPSLATRIRIALFFAAVAVQRRFALAPRLAPRTANA
ncbi:MAG TPA: FAD-dependent oxidoreductase [Candidatus Binatia bacterium]|nr:FAD-dependent oxidoreductase [Candidatus Binatia bacterium]